MRDAEVLPDLPGFLLALFIQFATLRFEVERVQLLLCSLAVISTVHKELKLDAASAPEGPDDSKAIKKILSGAVNIAVGVAELRNQGFGSGHGQASVPSGLGVRHARLTVNAAVTWRELILDTLGDPAAPWRKGKA